MTSIDEISKQPNRMFLRDVRFFIDIDHFNLEMMKAFLYSQDGSYAFPLAPKVTTIGRENCDISINSPQVDLQHALIEYEDQQRCFILKDLNSSSGTFVHDCRVQNAAVRLSEGDIIRFGFNGLPLQLRFEPTKESTMPSIYPRSSTTNPLEIISQTIPSRRCTTGISNVRTQQIDVRQNPEYQMRTRPSSAGAKKMVSTTNNSIVRSNAWTISSNTNRGTINGSFSADLDIPPAADTTDITNRVDQLEKEVKERNAEIRELNERLRTLEPLSSTFTTEVHTLRTELEKVKREKNAATSLVTSLQRDLHSKESDLSKLTNEFEALKNDSREKDLRLQSLQAKLNLLRDRGRTEEERYTKEKELVNLRNKIKMAEQQVIELTESVNRLKSQLQDTEKQLLRLNQNEQKFKQESEQIRIQLSDCQKREENLQNDLKKFKEKHDNLCNQLWKNLTGDRDEEFDEEEDNLLTKLDELRQQLTKTREELERQNDIQMSSEGQLKTYVNRLMEILNNNFNDETTQESLFNARQSLDEIVEENFPSTIKQSVTNVFEFHLRLFDKFQQLTNLSIDQRQTKIDAFFALIRQQNEKVENEKKTLTDEFVDREEKLRNEFEQMKNDREIEWQQRFDDECQRLQTEISRIQSENDEQIRLLNERLQSSTGETNDYFQKFSNLQNESKTTIDELNAKLNESQRNLNEQNQNESQLKVLLDRQREETLRIEKEKTTMIDDLNGQIEVYKDQVRQFSKTIVQLEKNLKDEQEKLLKVQNSKSTITAVPPPPLPPPPAPVPMPVPIVAVASDFSHELFVSKARIQEQEQIIVSLRRDLAGMAARLSDIQGEVNDKQKRALEKSDFIIRDQTKELNETRTKLSKLSDIVDKQSTQIESLKSDLSKSKVLANQYQLLVDQRQSEIDRLKKTLEEKNLIVARVEKTNQEEGRVTTELVAIGAQCKGERHEQTIMRQREALNELRSRIKALEQNRPLNPSYEKVLQQVVLLKRELAEMRARQALPTDLPFLTSSSSSAAAPIHSFGTPSSSDLPPEAQKIFEEHAAHVETMNTLNSCDDLHNSFTKKLIQLLNIDDESLFAVAPLASLPTADRYVAFQQRQRTIEILFQKIEMLRERLRRKEELLEDYEKDLARLRQAELLLREKDVLIEDLQTAKRTKEDETLFLRNTLKETQDHLNQEKRVNSAIKFGRNPEQIQQTELVRRSGSSTTTLHHHCPPDSNTKVRTVRRDFNEKLSRKDYEIKSLKQELNEALDTISEQSNKVKLLELQSKDFSNGSHHYHHHS